MSLSLFKTMMKLNGKTIISYAFGAAVYLLLAVWMYPQIAKSTELNKVIEQMPEGFLNAFGFEGGMPEDLSGFLAAEYYGLIFLLILMIYCVLLSTQLVARHVDRGSMAYLLATSTSRTKVAMTQAFVLVLGLFVIVLFTFLSGVLGASWFMEDETFHLDRFIHINVLGFLVFFVVSGYCFFFSCLFNDEKRALSVSGGITVLFFMISLVSKISDKLDWLQAFTLFTAYQPDDIARGTVDVLPVALGLLLAGLLFFALSILVFKKRDLPL
ncbi:ABC transporter permease subunit [Bacillus kexueae]|uniref:ABC transporter permease subunit n=1 Tax=Aeribacillus kexueae TaxID=2078952 RepID=UPI001FAEDC83|nr:ABC transporter permease subunit [Bacillus kexueae]